MEVVAGSICPNLSVAADAICVFCRRWRVREFSLFGSVLEGDFRENSDIDVLVDFLPGASLDIDDWPALVDELQAMFGREVHMVDKQTLVNPFRRRSILGTRKVIYEG